MSHRSLRESLSPYLDGLLPERRALRLERHLAECADCRRELAELRRTVELLHELPDPGAPPLLAERVMARVRTEQAERVARRGFFGRVAAPAAALAVGAVALLVVQGVEVEVGWPAWDGGVEEVATARPAPLATPSAPRRVPPAAGVSRQVAKFDPVEVEQRTPARTGTGPLPPLHACGAPAGLRDPGCARWQAWMVGLGTEDAPAFVAELESFPLAAREQWLRQLSDFAARAGSASLIAERLRETGDPRASSLALRFERTSAHR